MPSLSDYLRVRKPTQKEIDAVSDPHKYWFVKRRNMYQPIYAIASKQGLIFILITRLCLILLLVLLFASIIRIPLAVILLGALYGIDVLVKARKTFPEIERIRFNQYPDDPGPVSGINKKLEDTYDALQSDGENGRNH